MAEGTDKPRLDEEPSLSENVSLELSVEGFQAAEGRRGLT